MHAGGIAYAAAHGDAVGQGVAGPAGECVVRGIGQVGGAIGGHLRAFPYVGVQVAVSGADRPVVGQAADCGELHALDPLAAGLGRVAGIVEHGGVDLVVHVRLEQRKVHCQGVIQERPLAAHFEGLGLLRVQLGVVGTAGRAAQLEVGTTRGLLRDGVVGVDADGIADLVEGAELPVQQRIGRVQRRVAQHRAGRIAATRRAAAATTHRRAGILGLVVVRTHASGQQEAFAEGQGIEQVHRGGGGLAMCIGAVVRPVQAADVPVRVVQVRSGPAGAGSGGLAVAVQFFTGEFQASAQCVPDRAGGEVGAQVQLIGEDRVALVLEGRQAARDGVAGKVGRVGIGDVAGRAAACAAHAGAHEGGEQVILFGATPAGGVGQAHAVVEVVLETERGHLRGHVIVVGAGAVEVLRIDRVPGQRFQRRLRRPARQAQGGHATIWHVVLLHIQQVEVVAGGGTQTEGQRRCDAPALVLHVVAAGLVAVLPHAVDAQRAGGAQRLVPVGGGAALLVAAQRNAGRRRVLQVGLLADKVDRAGRRRTAIVGAGRPLGYFHLFDVEHIARDRAQVAHTVHIQAVGGVEAAHEQRIAGGRVAVLAGIEGAHAGAVAQRLGEGRGTLLVEQVAGNHLDGLRRVLQALGELRRGHLVGFVAPGGVHVDLVQRAGVVGGFSVGQRGQGGQAEAGGKTGGGQRQGTKRRSVLAALDRVHGRLQKGNRERRPARAARQQYVERGGACGCGCAWRSRASGQQRGRCVGWGLAPARCEHRRGRCHRRRSVCRCIVRVLQAESPQGTRFVTATAIGFGFSGVHRLFVRQHVWRGRGRHIMSIQSRRIGGRRVPAFMQRRPAQHQRQQHGHEQRPPLTGKLAQRGGGRGRSHGAGAESLRRCYVE
ncbi:hypothetical protein PGKDCPLP_03675 [Stenotrophomonas maltophilia]|nr:hypothetical protein PGKDCPLP_03675 [Stenotrophomonas maltophilia]